MVKVKIIKSNWQSGSIQIKALDFLNDLSHSEHLTNMVKLNENKGKPPVKLMSNIMPTDLCFSCFASIPHAYELVLC